ncbi:MAG: triacylglycerol lipase [Ruminococcus sp.]|uniref:esterase/lipase family protein n=1 Tax=Ruminococcus sp. TaxID=41978 RepID=UPI0025D78B8C|nr:triacylglycerol lipase [Ruminococcus sp.]MCR5542280.1 triacylglycerol lipase [Ruminococcus sp.]
MRKIRLLFDQLLTLALCNSVILWTIVQFSTAVKILAIVVLVLFYFVYLISAGGRADQDKKLCRIAKGSFLIDGAVISLVLHTAVVLTFIIIGEFDPWRIFVNGLTGYAIIAFAALVGIIRLVISSRQVKIVKYIALIFTWYMPVVNIFVLRTISKSAKKEFRFEQAKQELDDMRKENEVCKTKYPILMVHGIFFRDWQMFNYWGRVPKELVRNGAEIYYGGQQSANLISVSAGELRDKIEEVIKETGAEKLNIIAHSKGGLDSRYAISKLGMDKYVASLVTINTPHYGCNFVDDILAKVSDGLLKFVANRYNKLFTVLGDTAPDFEKGLRELTHSNCAKLDDELPDRPGVYYRSVMSVMKNDFSAGFPLNLGYMLNRKDGTGNDGLVVKESALRGENTLMINHNGNRGLSHGDMIDLFRENIDGFDVREFYVDIVKDLKERGL